MSFIRTFPCALIFRPDKNNQFFVIIRPGERIGVSCELPTDPTPSPLAQDESAELPYMTHGREVAHPQVETLKADDSALSLGDETRLAR